MSVINKDYANGLAAAVDADLSVFRSIQTQIQNLREQQQQLMGQANENEMVKSELALLDGNAQVFKLVGPVLMKHDTADAKTTVDQRLEKIAAGMTGVEKKMKDLEEESNKIAAKIQDTQNKMQSEAKSAAQQAAQEAAV
jgi:prefoldin beta subunit